MPAESKAQQRFMGLVRAVQRGKTKAPSKEIADVAKSMRPADVRDFAKTKHEGLPERKKRAEVVLNTRKPIGQRIPGGEAEGKSPSDFDAGQLALGKKVEREHTPDSGVATEIAMDHLQEIDDYYTRLARMERAAKQEKASMSTRVRVLAPGLSELFGFKKAPKKSKEGVLETGSQQKEAYRLGFFEACADRGVPPQRISDVVGVACQLFKSAEIAFNALKPEKPLALRLGAAGQRVLAGPLGRRVTVPAVRGVPKPPTPTGPVPV